MAAKLPREKAPGTANLLVWRSSSVNSARFFSCVIQIMTVAPIARQTSLLGGFVAVAPEKPTMASQQEWSAEEWAAWEAEEKKREEDAAEALRQWQEENCSTPPAAKRPCTTLARAENIYDTNFKDVVLKAGTEGYEWLKPDRFNLSPAKDGWLFLPWGMQTQNFEKKTPSFITGTGDDDTPFLKASVKVPPELGERILALEAHLQSESKGRGAWNDTLRNDSICVRIYFAGEKKTSFRMLVHDGPAKIGEGWDFLKPFAQSESKPFRGCPVKMVVKMNLYNKGGKRGISIRVQQMVINTRETQAAVEVLEEFDDE